MIGVRIGDWELEETKDGDVRLIFDRPAMPDPPTKAVRIKLELCEEELEELGAGVESFLKLKGKQI